MGEAGEGWGGKKTQLPLGGSGMRRSTVDRGPGLERNLGQAVQDTLRA